MRYLILLLLFTSVAFADTCITDKISGDKTCVVGNVTYVYPSPATLEARAEAQAQVDADAQAAQKQEQLIQDNMRALAIQDLQNQGLITDEQATAETGKLTTLSTATGVKTGINKIR